MLEEQHREAPGLRPRLRPQRRPREIRVSRQRVIPANLRRQIQPLRRLEMQRRDRARLTRTRPTALRSLLRIRTIRIIRIQTRTILMRRRIIRTLARIPAAFRLHRIRLRLRALRIQVRLIPVLPIPVLLAAVRLQVPDALRVFLYLHTCGPDFGSAFLWNERSEDAGKCGIRSGSRFLPCPRLANSARTSLGMTIGNKKGG
jgi:hypothetical protein